MFGGVFFGRGGRGAGGGAGGMGFCCCSEVGIVSPGLKIEIIWFRLYELV